MPSLRLLPHGGYTLIPAVFSTVAWLAALSQDGCDYARLTGFTAVTVTESKETPFLELGFNAYRQPSLINGEWKVDHSGPCIAYDDQNFSMDGYWMAAKGFAFVSLVLGGGGALFLWCSSCFVFSRGTWKWAGYEVFLAFIFQSLAFLWFNTYICREGDNQCSMYFGSKADIAAAGLWLCSALVIFCRYPAPKAPMDDQDDDHQPVIQHGTDDDIMDSASQQGGEETSELKDDNDVPIEGDADATMQVEEKKGNETVVQTTPADADLI